MSAVALLVALATALTPATAKYPPDPPCRHVIPMLGYDTRLVGGEFRTVDGDCIVWASLAQQFWKSRVCALANHEARHLHGDRHPIPRERSCRP